MGVGWVECSETQRSSNIIASSQVRTYALFVGRPLGRKMNFTTENSEALRLLARGFVGWVECNETQRFSDIITSSQARKYVLSVGCSLGR
jgi:hypothetical protein